VSYSTRKELPDNYYLLSDELHALLKKFGNLERMHFLGVRAISKGNFYYWNIGYKWAKSISKGC
jgi:hypothetical protein